MFGVETHFCLARACVTRQLERSLKAADNDEHRRERVASVSPPDARGYDRASEFHHAGVRTGSRCLFNQMLLRSRSKRPTVNYNCIYEYY